MLTGTTNQGIHLMTPDMRQPAVTQWGTERDFAQQCTDGAHPGPIVTPRTSHVPGTAAALSDPDFAPDVVERIAGLHRVGKPVDVSGAVIYLASPGATPVTGATPVVDGGWTAR